MASGKLLIRNGRIIDPANKVDAAGDLLLDAGKVAQVGGKNTDRRAETLDADGHASSISGPPATL